MDKQHFTLYIIPPRADFAKNMTEEEAAIMQEHVAYWTNNIYKGTALVFGPVFEPDKVYGLAVVAVLNEKKLLSLIENDPAVKLNTYKYFPMNAVRIV